MKRRDFLKVGAGLVLGLFGNWPEPKAIEIGIDKAEQRPDQTVVRFHPVDAATSDDMGGCLVPPEYVNRIIAAMEPEIPSSIMVGWPGHRESADG